MLPIHYMKSTNGDYYVKELETSNYSLKVESNSIKLRVGFYVAKNVTYVRKTKLEVNFLFFWNLCSELGVLGCINDVAILDYITGLKLRSLVTSFLREHKIKTGPNKSTCLPDCVYKKQTASFQLTQVKYSKPAFLLFFLHFWSSFFGHLTKSNSVFFLAIWTRRPCTFPMINDRLPFYFLHMLPQLWRSFFVA